MRLHHLIRRARIATIAAMFAAISVSVFAQNGQSQFSISLQQASAQAAAQLQTESVRRLSIDEAVTMAMEQNLGIRIQRFDPQIQDTSVAQARSFWAPNLTTSFNRNSQTLQSTNTFTGSGASTLNQSFFNQVIFNQTLPTGARVLGHVEQRADDHDEPLRDLCSQARFGSQPAILAAADAQLRNRSDSPAGGQQQEEPRALRHSAGRCHHWNAASGQECVLGFVLCDREPEDAAAVAGAVAAVAEGRAETRRDRRQGADRHRAGAGRSGEQ